MLFPGNGGGSGNIISIKHIRNKNSRNLKTEKLIITKITIIKIIFTPTPRNRMMKSCKHLTLLYRDSNKKMNKCHPENPSLKEYITRNLITRTFKEETLMSHLLTLMDLTLSLLKEMMTKGLLACL
jgi:hypothetical protein